MSLNARKPRITDKQTEKWLMASSQKVEIDHVCFTAENKFSATIGRPHEGFLLFSPFFRGHQEIYREFYKNFSVRNVSVSRGDIVGYSTCTVTLDWNLASIEMRELPKSAVIGAAMSMEEEKPAMFCFRKKETVNAPQAHRVYLRYFAYWRCFPHLKCFAFLRRFDYLRCIAYLVCFAFLSCFPHFRCFTYLRGNLFRTLRFSRLIFGKSLWKSLLFNK